MQKRRSVVVVGGGITGLSAAWYLQQGGASLDVTLVESESRLGGKVLTERGGGFLVEGGPESFLAQKPWALNLARELGIEGEVVRPTVSQVYLLYRGALHEIPEGLLGLVPVRPSALWKASFLSFAGKARASLEPLRPGRRSQDDESLRRFLTRRLGRQWADRLGEPLMAGIHAGDGERLSMQALFPNLVAWECKYGSIARALRKEAPPVPHTKRVSPFVTFAGGAAALTGAIAQRLASVRIITGRRVMRLTKPGPSYLLTLDKGEQLTAESIVLTTPAYASAQILLELAPQASALLDKLGYASTASVTLAFKRSAVAHPLNGSGFIMARSERQPFTACTWSSAKWAGRAPEGYALLRAFAGWSGDDSFMRQDDATLVRSVAEALRPLLSIQGEPEKTWVHRWVRAMPQYHVGHLAWIDSVQKALAAHPDVALTGAAFHGVGLPDCVRQGKEAAERVLATAPAQGES
ncbi:MAG: protoporphyrinogen oxidase [Chloroflexi bacterium]|nr:protoporphyrinogen oxidase [Chloroflexota bacterium]